MVPLSEAFSKFAFGSDSGVDTVFSCGSLTIFEMAIGTGEACLFKYSFKGIECDTTYT